MSDIQLMIHWGLDVKLTIYVFFVNLMSDISLLLYSHYNVRHTLDASLYIECHRNIILSVESEYQAYHWCFTEKLMSDLSLMLYFILMSDIQLMLYCKFNVRHTIDVILYI